MSNLYFLPPGLLLKCSKCNTEIGTVQDLLKKELYCSNCKAWIKTLELSKQVAVITNIKD
jgi:hypothetical protein